ncbi:MAG: acyltransferase [Candidatus Ancillula sp.]|jgi:peptidoglycan/LPS O-acetylase OafA/YrhL|nr:acyltransferase [Candidatus Ancillula sp.]
MNVEIEQPKKKNIFYRVLFRTPRPGFRADIQAMRALAVIAVVLYHLWPDKLLTGGFTGVDIFFVISGYLMTLHIVKGLEAGGFEKGKRLRFFANFYARRIRRLLPAAIFTLLLVLAILVVLLPKDYYTQSLTTAQIIASALFVQNWKLAADKVDYLAQNNEATAVQHFWSLSVEEQFYFIWPLLLMLFMLIGLALSAKIGNKLAEKADLKGYDAKQMKTRNVLRIFVFGFTLLFFIFGVYFTNANAAAAYFITPARLWELSIGGCIALSTPLIVLLTRKTGELSKFGRVVYEVLPFIGVGICLYGIMKFNSGIEAGFPGFYALVPTIGAAIIIWSGMQENEQRFTLQDVVDYTEVDGKKTSSSVA